MRSFRRVGGILLAMLIVAAVVLGFWEIHRQSTIQLVTAQVLADQVSSRSSQVKVVDPKALETEFQDPNKFATLIDNVRKQAAAIDAHDRVLEHVEVQLAKEINPKGRESRRRATHRTDLAGGNEKVSTDTRVHRPRERETQTRRPPIGRDWIPARSKKFFLSNSRLRRTITNTILRGWKRSTIFGPSR